MSDSTWKAFSERVSWDARFHATCEPAERPAPAALASVNDRNANVLVAVAALMDRRVDTGDEDNALSHEVARLDAKLNVLMEIVNRLLLPQSALPPRISLRFNALGVVLPWDGLPPVGES
ncbi:PilZ domain-containing protein, partial [Luteibacter sp.]|uniref:PilZ domain-containing protein n=1 Tax=Luteibacter sp. TaxID=1886636 RepID=UPI003F821368